MGRTSGREREENILLGGGVGVGGMGPSMERWGTQSVVISI